MVEVPLGPCQCPNTPHETDVVYMFETKELDTKRSWAILQRSSGNDADLEGFALVQSYARFGIADWNLAGLNGKKLELNAANLSAFSDRDPRALIVGHKGDDLYSDAVIVPLAKAVARFSPSSPTTNGSSPPNGHRPKSRTRSKRSSISTTPMDDTAPISESLAGVSNS